MAVEDFTTYTLLSAGGTIGVTSTRVTSTAFDTRSTPKGYVEKDKGAAHFTGDFSHNLTIFFNPDLGMTAQWVVWQLSNSLGDEKDLGDANLPFMSVFVYDVPNFLTMRDYRSSTYSDSSQYALTANTIYYLTIARVGTGLSCKVYSDSGRTSLLQTLSITLASATAFQYVGTTTGYSDGSGPSLASGYVENLDLQEGGAGPSIAINSMTIPVPGKRFTQIVMT